MHKSHILTTAKKFIIYFVNKQRGYFYIQFILCLMWSLKESLFPMFIKNMLNNLYSQNTKIVILWNIILQGGSLFLLWIVIEFAMRLHGILAAHSFSQFRADIRTYIFHHINNKNYSYFNTYTTGDIISKFSDMPRACESVLEIFLLHVTSISAAVIISITLLALTDLNFAIISVIWLISHLWANFHWAKICHQSTEKHAKAVADLNGNIADIFMNIKNVFIFGQEKNEIKKFMKYQKEEIMCSKNARWVIEKLKIFQSLLAIIYLILLLVYLMLGWFHNTISTGDFALVPMLVFNLLGMVWWFSSQIPIIFRETGCITTGLTSFVDTTMTKNKSKKTQLKVHHGEIIFHDISFNYPDGKQVFKNLSLSIPSKQKIGLIGFSGSGKSTLIQLLLRLYDINEGSIMIDKQNIYDFSYHSLYKKISVIPQEIILFNRSIYENIKYSNISATDEEVYAAARVAGCHDFIKLLPQSYNSLAGEKGTLLSGGQRQRICIARAMLKKSPILILDEATSSLDSITESVIQHNFEKLAKNKTTIVITHNLNILEIVDRIIVLDQGQIVGDGSKDSLLKTNSFFKAMNVMN